MGKFNEPTIKINEGGSVITIWVHRGQKYFFDCFMVYFNFLKSEGDYRSYFSIFKLETSAKKLFAKLPVLEFCFDNLQ